MGAGKRRRVAGTLHASAPLFSPVDPFRYCYARKLAFLGLKHVELVASVAEPEPESPEPYHFDPRRTGSVSLL
jgi:hypothetical protein